MRIVHISDIHLTENGTEIWGINTLEHFQKAIHKIKEMDGLDGIIVSGDLSNDGSKWTYEYIDRAFEETGVPTYCCPGNHDNLEMFYQGYKPSYYKICEKFELCGWNFIMLNSAVPDMSRGYFNPDVLMRLLKSCDGPVAIVLHHPPVEQDGWLNRKLLDNKSHFKKIIEHFHNVKLVLYGHSHYASFRTFEDIIYNCSPSIGFAFSPKLPKFEIACGEEGFSLIDTSNDDISINTILI